jgi:Holliday junction resolvase
MSEAKWKRCEREVARLLGGERLPNTGRRGPDVVAGPWACEVKLRSRLPLWLERALHQVAVAAEEMGRTPLLVLVCPRGRGRPPLRLAVLRLEALMAWRRESGDDGKEVTP